MSEGTRGSQPVAAQERPAGELVKDLSEQVSHLIRDELRLAQLEMTRKGKQAGLGIGLFAGSGGIAVYGLGCLIACAVALPSRMRAVIFTPVRRVLSDRTDSVRPGRAGT